MQLAWNLRPFVGEKTMEFELFRKKEGNFYLEVLRSTGNLFYNPKNKNKQETPAKSEAKELSINTDTAKTDTVK